ncbi:MAG: sugar-transfer associated ATP-grasp domain-containing protein [Hyphomicrobiales bacterium]
MNAQAAEKIVRDDASDHEGQEHGDDNSEALIAERDYETPAINTMLERVAKEFGKPYGAQVGELARLCIGGNKLSAEEYYELRLFDEKYTPEQKLEFIGIRKSREIWTDAYTDNDFWGVIIDKIASGGMFKGLGLPTTETLAIYSGTVSVPAIESLKDGADIAAFLRANRNRAMFAKPVSSYQSLGSVAIDRVEDDAIRCGDGTLMPIDEFVRFVTEEFADGYLFQARVSPHVDIARICGNRIATARIVTTCVNREADVMRAALKLPVGESMADNFWRGGNIIADVDLKTGRMGRAVSGFGLDQIETPHHPDTNAPITGTVLPMWREAVDLALDGQRLLSRIPLIGWDIAISNTGPLIIEANETPDLKMMQYASGEGMLDGKFRTFVSALRDARAAEKARLKKKAMKFANAEGARQIKGAMKRA